MDVQQIAPGLWRWTARHPDWEPNDGWEPEVGCVYGETDEAVLLVDPLVPVDEPERFWAALDRDVERVGLPVAVLLTVFWHERDAQAVRDRYGAEVWAHEPALDRLQYEVTHPFRTGQRLPGGAEAFATGRRDEVVYWLPTHRAVAVGDVLHGRDEGIVLCPLSWLEPEGPDAVKGALRPLLDLPVERVLVSHGEPVLAGGRDALGRALT